MNRRTFIPTTRYVGNTGVPRSVVRWEWSRREGLMVVYDIGIRIKSEWKTLTKFLAAVRDNHEGPVVEVSGGGQW